VNLDRDHSKTGRRSAGPSLGSGPAVGQGSQRRGEPQRRRLASTKVTPNSALTLVHPALLRELEREFGEPPAEVEGMSDIELRAYLTVLWERRARDSGQEHGTRR
jgi:hypothetical protein